MNVMKLKCFTKGILACAALLAVSAVLPMPAEAAGYTYTSEKYGYSIECPTKPVGVIPLSALAGDDQEAAKSQGDVLIFANDGYDIKKGWIVMIDAFDEASVPDLDKISKEDGEAFCTKLKEKSGYEYASIINLSEHKAIYVATAKKIDIDTNGDGVVDTVGEADNQMVKTFFRGKNQRYAVELIDNPTLTTADIEEYQSGVYSFKELDKTTLSKPDKKDVKSKK